ncbi:MAK10-like protein [Tanacetum coccineum]
MKNLYPKHGLISRTYPKKSLIMASTFGSNMTMSIPSQDEPLTNRPVLDVEQEEGNPGNTTSNPHPQPDPFASIATEQVRKLNSMLESLGLVPQSSNTKFGCSKEDDGEVMFIEIIRDDDEPQNEGLNEGEGAIMEEPVVEYFNTFPNRDELTYHMYLISGPIPSIFLRNPIITEGCLYNLKIPCNIGHMHIEKAYIDLNSPLNIMTRMMYNWIMRRKLDPKENKNGGVINFIGMIKGMHVFIGNFTYIVDFMIVEDISSIIDPRLSQVVLGRPFIEMSDMTHDPPEGVVRFTKVYLRNDEDKRRGVEYVMSKILGFYKECLELGPEYLTGMDDEGEVTLYLIRKKSWKFLKFIGIGFAEDDLTNRHAHTFLDHDSKHQSRRKLCCKSFSNHDVFDLEYEVEFRISLTGFRSCASRSQTGASQSRQSTE